ncbi:MAG TPA: polysaccharide biosynthesis tyrosine autokinase [Bryobacteraceae bacterium]|jgi:capsular exopolysaccharide synthesis family protein|nr:polysaccharide biosynthesis tyrosine autokinase [Bryobacteraceae bacterium]
MAIANHRGNLPAVVNEGRQETVQYQPVYVPEPEAPEQAIPLAHYLWIIRRHRWRILAFIAASVLGTYIVSERIAPVYQAEATIDIDRQSPEGLIGQDANRTSLNDADQFIATQIGLVRSDAVLRPVADKYDLLRSEKQITKDDAPERVAALRRAPVVLKKLKLTRPPNTYLLLISYRSHDPLLAANVANAIAKSYIETTYSIRYRSSSDVSAFMEKQLEELKAKMERSSAALAKFEKELNVIDPEEKTSILTARLLQLNTEYTNAQADRVKKEAAYEAVKGGSLEAAQVSTQGESLKTLEDRLNDAEQKFADVRSRFGSNHPEYKKASGQVAEIKAQLDRGRKNIMQRVSVEYEQAVNREKMLSGAVQATKSEFDRMNAHSIDYQAIKREAEADKKFYEELIQRIREATINAGFQNSSIRLANLARPPVRPVYPNLKLNLPLAFLFSTLLAFGGALISDVLDNTLRDPEQVHRKLNTDVVGILPLARSRPSLLAQNGGTRGALMRLSDLKDNKKVGAYVEAIRTLRNSILLRNLEQPLGSILVTSAAPKEGKTTTAVHLALAHAEQRHRTLLIDCDLRRPSVHKYFDFPNEVGMTDVSLGTVPWRDAVVKVDDPTDLHLLLSGHASRRAADLVGKALAEILAEGCDDYDLIVVDAPPMLGFPEPLQIATSVDGVVVVTLAGETNRQAVTSVLNTLHRLRATVTGIVLNKMNRDLTDGYYYYGYYAKYNKHYYQGTPNNESA